jgi:hypothetical protein
MASLILNKEGKTVLDEGEGFPIDISIAALTKINETLGKSKAKSSIQNNGTPQK